MKLFKKQIVSLLLAYNALKSKSAKTEEQELKKPIAAALRPNAPITPRECIGKKINNLNRKLRDIEILEQRIKSGVLGNPEKTQLEKIARRETITKEIDRLTVEIEKL
uniref:Bm5871 n=1 Tax=Brugia malayi TaxID=6279 RepID=A0A0H5S9K0_BRUMA|nr:Bm5871 [Brugia malayi]